MAASPAATAAAIAQDRPGASAEQPAHRRVVYATSNRLTALADRLPSNPGRSRQVHELVRTLGLLDHSGVDPKRAKAIPPAAIGKKELARFHGEDFIDFLLSQDALADGHLRARPSSPSSACVGSHESEDDDDASEGRPTRPVKRRRTATGPSTRHARYGLVDDSPAFEGLAEYCLAMAGGSLAAAQEVRDGRADVGICWDGGRHHAKRSSCSGFCYINDAVLVVLALGQKRVPDERREGKMRKARVMYIDFDIHHGDGVAEAFMTVPPSKPSVLTLSIHHHATLFFPSGEGSRRTAPDTPTPHTLSLPLGEGTSAASFSRAWASVEQVKRAWRPDFVVVCCGVDGLAGDGKGVWNLSTGEDPGDLGWAVRQICDWQLGTVLLGGGGYTHPSVARAWAQFTSIALGHRPLAPSHPLPVEELSEDFAESYAPSYDLGVPAGNMRDRNTEDDLAETERVFAVLAARIDIGSA